MENSQSALAQLQRAANSGNAVAEYHLAMYFLNQGQKQDDADAVHWLRRAINHGNIDAKFILGLAYCYGRGLRRNVIHGTSLIEAATKQGSAVAATMMNMFTDS